MIICTDGTRLLLSFTNPSLVRHLFPLALFSCTVKVARVNSPGSLPIPFQLPGGRGMTYRIEEQVTGTAIKKKKKLMRHSEYIRLGMTDEQTR